MLKRKIYNKIEEYLKAPSNKMLLIDGAKQIGKSYIIRSVGQSLYPNYIEINMEEDKQGNRLFAEVKTTNDFYLALSSFAGDKMGDKESTLVFIDEIQAYDHLLTLVKFLMQENKFTYIASGSQLGITLKKTQSIPGGSYERIRMFPLDFEEFLWANGVGELAIDSMRDSFSKRECLNEGMHKRIMDLLRKYLLVGGLPDAVNSFVADKNIIKYVRYITIYTTFT
ncbi:MAG: AAA family ATPase [Paludibacteraceae bacterium]|nr:AAA family ATPase [Paludibacteraceae bacterium]